MKRTIGLWIDHKKAVIVFVAGQEEEIKQINSNIEKHRRQSGVSMPADDVRQRVLTGHLNTYYDEVVSCIRDAESILILGPGEAKSELKQRLEADNLGGRIVGLETVDKLSDPQIGAKVREHFLEQKAATSSRSSN
jgi:hypothetical protein